MDTHLANSTKKIADKDDQSRIIDKNPTINKNREVGDLLRTPEGFIPTGIGKYNGKGNNSNESDATCAFNTSSSFSEFLNGETHPYTSLYHGLSHGDAKNGIHDHDQSFKQEGNNNDNGFEQTIDVNRSFWDEYEEEAFNAGGETNTVGNLLSTYSQNMPLVSWQSRYMYGIPKMTLQSFLPEHHNRQQSSGAFDNYPYFTGLPSIPSRNINKIEEGGAFRKAQEMKLNPQHHHHLGAIYNDRLLYPTFKHDQSLLNSDNPPQSAFVKLKEINSAIPGEKESLPHVTIRGKVAMELDEALLKKTKKQGFPNRNKKRSLSEEIFGSMDTYSSGNNLNTNHHSLSNNVFTFSGTPGNTDMINYNNVKPKTKRQKHVCRACVHCKRAHLACDNARPCRRCVHLGKSDCVDVEHKRRGRPKSNPDKRISAPNAMSLTGVQRPNTVYKNELIGGGPTAEALTNCSNNITQICTDILRPTQEVKSGDVDGESLYHMSKISLKF